MSEEDQRRHTRLAIRTHVFVSNDEITRFKTMTTDFSDGGLFIEGKSLAGLPIDTILLIQSAEGIEDAPVVKARVAWSNRYGVGVQYLLED